jgi:hypothetical protein
LAAARDFATGAASPGAGWINHDENDLRAGCGEPGRPILRDEIILTLDALAGPLGPQTSFDERLARQDRWVDEGDVELLAALLEVVASPPPEEQLRHASLDDWNTLLVEVRHHVLG